MKVLKLKMILIESLKEEIKWFYFSKIHIMGFAIPDIFATSVLGRTRFSNSEKNRLIEFIYNIAFNNIKRIKQDI